MNRAAAVAAAAFAATLLTGCSGVREVPVTVESVHGAHRFHVEVARTPAEQARGLMFRTRMDRDGGMLFAPFAPDGTGPRVAAFWMKDTPLSLDILFIGEDGRIANIAADAVPFSRSYLMSNGPVAAVLEVAGGRARQLGIAAGDRVAWPGAGAIAVAGRGGAG